MDKWKNEKTFCVGGGMTFLRYSMLLVFMSFLYSKESGSVSALGKSEFTLNDFPEVLDDLGDGFCLPWEQNSACNNLEGPFDLDDFNLDGSSTMEKVSFESGDEEMGSMDEAVGSKKDPYINFRLGNGTCRTNINLGVTAKNKKIGVDSQIFQQMVEKLLNEHDSKHTLQESGGFKKIVCVVEGCSFSMQKKSESVIMRAYVQHLRGTHIGLYPYFCKLKGCEERFSLPGVATNHLKKHKRMVNLKK